MVNASKGKEEIAILLVEDNRIIAQAARGILNHLGYYNLWVTDNGIDAMEYVFYHPVDLILLDIGLPDISGIEVCKRIRSMENVDTIPIIAFSTMVDFMEAEYLDAGFNDFLHKPFTPETMKNILQKWEVF